MFDDPQRLGNSGRRVAACLQAGRPAFVGYFPVGYPSVTHSLEAIRAIAQGTDGHAADIIEIGIPYSDPLMDGIVIQRATTAALKQGVRTRDAFAAVETAAEAGATPMVMTYWNLIEAYGVERFARDFANAGGAGLITPDLPADDCDEWIAASDAHDLDRVFLIAPSSLDERLTMTMQRSRGWVYATSVMGVTGARAVTSDAGPVIVERARRADPTIPVGIGLGVSSAQQAAEIGAYADLVIVGSALINAMMTQGNDLHANLHNLKSLSQDIAAGVARSRS